MRYTQSARVQFPAGHSLPIQDHSHPHGHLFSVLVEEDVEFGDANPDLLKENLWTICRELANRNLNEMMLGSEPSLISMSTWILERMIQSHPNVLVCEVSLHGEHVAVRATRTTHST